MYRAPALTMRGIRMSDAQWKKVIKLAKKEGISPSAMVRLIIERA